MNPQKSIQPDLFRYFLTFVCGPLLTAIPAKTRISVALNNTVNIQLWQAGDGSPFG